MLRSYQPILILLAIAFIFVAASFAASILLAPRRRTMAKTAPYECGIVPERDTQERFSVKFYLLAIAFIVLDVEIIFLYPFATVFVRRTLTNGIEIAGLGSAGLAVMGIFLLVLLFPFAYLLSTGVLHIGPITSKVSKIVKPIQRSQGFVRSSSSLSASRPSGQSEPVVSSFAADVRSDEHPHSENGN